VPLYFMGARIDALYPLGPVFHGAGLNITVMSNAGTVHVGAIACRESVPDADALVQHFPTELERLQKAVAATRHRVRRELEHVTVLLWNQMRSAPSALS
jgi:diacylglycerol O-acyltransferase